MLTAGDKAPSFSLADAATGEIVDDPWRAGRAVVAFFKTTCPVCQMVAPKLTLLAKADAPVIAIGQDAPATIQSYTARHGQHLPTLSEPAPYEVSTAFGISTVPTLFLVEPDGIISDVVESWDRDRWNRLAQSLGVAPVSDESDGLPVFRPG